MDCSNLNILERYHEWCSPIHSYTWTHQCLPTSKKLHSSCVDTGFYLKDLQEQWPIGTVGERKIKGIWAVGTPWWWWLLRKKATELKYLHEYATLSKSKEFELSARLDDDDYWERKQLNWNTCMSMQPYLNRKDWSILEIIYIYICRKDNEREIYTWCRWKLIFLTDMCFD